MTIIVLLLAVAVAAANGANDVSKGVATLAGAGVTRYRTAIIWGSAATLVGGIGSIITGHAMSKLFSSGIIASHPVTSFSVAVLCGTLAWVALASVARLPVSTTHAIVGSLVGAGLLFAPSTIEWGSLITKVMTPLLISIAVAYGISMLAGVAAQLWRHWRGSGSSTGAAGHELETGSEPARSEAPHQGSLATATVATVTEAPSPASGAGHAGGRRAVAILHWISAWGTCMARALNDTPKIAAVGAFALIPAGMSSAQVTVVVAVAMGLGSLLGIRVARTLGDRVVRMGHVEGFRANVITALLVGVGAQVGWPMSTTHVSTGSISGIPGTKVRRLNGKIIRDFVIAWTVTPLCAGLVAAAVYLLVR